VNDLDRVFAAASAVCQEATRRWFGDPHDARLDVPLAMLLDLSETLGVDLPAAHGPTDEMSRDGSEGLSDRLAAERAAS
jgi:hypothetical protein